MSRELFHLNRTDVKVPLVSCHVIKVVKPSEMPAAQQCFFSPLRKPGYRLLSIVSAGAPDTLHIWFQAASTGAVFSSWYTPARTVGEPEGLLEMLVFPASSLYFSRHTAHPICCGPGALASLLVTVSKLRTFNERMWLCQIRFYCFAVGLFGIQLYLVSWIFKLKKVNKAL